MYRIRTFNKISPVGLNRLDPALYAVSDSETDEDAILVRSAKLLDYDFPKNLLAISRAGAGVNNIPLDRCSEAGIVVFNTPGANANAVKELAVCALLLASRKISDGVAWVKEQAAAGADVEQAVEKGKSQFVGPELSGKMLGVIGLGAIGVQVANIATKLGMTVFGYDPFLSVDGALSLSRLVHRAMDLETIYKNCDYITLHVPQTPETKGMFNEDAFHMMKGGVRILNLARGTLVNDDDMLAALDSGKVACYVTDFPNNKITLAKNVVAIPHLGASSPESEENCAVMAAQELKDYLENGNIRNSVNYPACDMGVCSQAGRIAIFHKNIANMLNQFTAVIGEKNINISDMTNKSRGEVAYTMLDIENAATQDLVESLQKIDGVFRVRVVK